MIAPSIFASSDSRCGLYGGVEQEPAAADGQHVRPVAEHDQRAHLRPHDAVEAVAQRRARRDRGERGVERVGRGPRTVTSAEPTDGGRSVGPIATDRRLRGQRLGDGVDTRSSSMPATPFGELAGTIARAEPEPRRLGQPARRVRHLAQLAGQADLAEHHEVGRQRTVERRADDRQAHAPGRRRAR